MNPLAAGLRQPDARSCGAASVVMARLLRDAVAPTTEEFRAEVLATHRRLTSAFADGRWQLPWPRIIGTPPWAVGRELERVSGRPHHVRSARWSAPAAYDLLARGGGALYVGSRTLPRHVVLVLAPTSAHPDPGAPLRCYEPASGRVVALAREEFVGGRLHAAGWAWPWWAITPAGPAAAPALRPRRR